MRFYIIQYTYFYTNAYVSLPMPFFFPSLIIIGGHIPPIYLPFLLYSLYKSSSPPLSPPHFFLNKVEKFRSLILLEKQPTGKNFRNKFQVSFFCEERFVKIYLNYCDEMLGFGLFRKFNNKLDSFKNAFSKCLAKSLGQYFWGF